MIDLQSLAFEYIRFISRLGNSTGGIDGVENLLTLALLAALIALSLMAGRRFASAPVYCAALLVSLFLVRLPMFLPVLRVPDEAQVLASAGTLLHHPLFWKSVDGTTNGPLNHYLLVLMRLVGLPLTFATARFANVLTWWGATVFLFLTARLVLPEWAARLSALPMLAAGMLFRFDHFVQYSSESLPVAMIACAVWLLARCHVAAGDKSTRWMPLGLLLAALPFAKLQTLPTVAVLAVAALASIYAKPREAKWKSAAWFAAGGMLLLLPLLALLAAFGLFRDFYESYLLNNLIYANQAEVVWTPGSFFDFVFQQPEASRFLSWMAVFIGIVILHQLWRKARRPSAGGWLAIGLVVAAIYSAYRPGRSFQHYLLFLFFPVSLAAVLALASELRHSRRATAIGAMFAILTIALPVFLGAMDADRSSLAYCAELPEKAASPATRRISELAKPGEPIAVWGYEPFLYVLTGTVPGTRDAQTQRQIDDGPQRPYYRQRFLNDLKANPPKLFADAVGPGLFAYTDRQTQGYESVPELRDYIDSHYELADDVQNIRLFVRRGSDVAPPENPLPTPLAIRCGGGALTDPQGRQWAADAFFYGGAERAFRADNAWNLSPIYLAEHVCRQSCEYRIPVRNGDYTVRLHFIENATLVPGANVFDVKINQADALHDFDIVREAGGMRRPLVREFDTVVNNGKITIGLLPKVREAKLSAIEILSSPQR